MFSQYSWWDFIKVVLVLAIPYYAYVLWTYYREDIREWISNRGRSQDANPPTPVTIEEQEDETESTLFVVNDYTDSQPPTSENSRQSTRHQSAEWLPEPAVSTSTSPVPVINPPEPEAVQLQGPAVADETETVGFALLMQSENAEEQSVEDLGAVAQRLTNTGNGLLKPKDVSDQPAARLADIINQQRTNPLNDVAFNR